MCHLKRTESPLFPCTHRAQILLKLTSPRQMEEYVSQHDLRRDDEITQEQEGNSMRSEGGSDCPLMHGKTSLKF